MKLTTPIEITPAVHKLSPAEPTLLLGSCFAQSFGERLTTLRFRANTNPRGPLYNPTSLLTAAHSLATARRYTLADLHPTPTGYLSLDHSTKFASANAEELLARLNSSQPATYSTLILTLGTAWTYSLDGRTVANCHKLPASLFTRRRLGYAETLAAITEIRNLHPAAHIILTVSPIRHTKDGLTENATSKAILRAAAAEATETLENTSYFPAFEIMLDELRDYRFYTPDMVHPSPQAIDYIFSRFADTYFTPQTNAYIKKIEKILAALNHHPIDPQTPDHQAFRNATRAQLDSLAKEYAELDFSDLFANFA